MFQLFYTLSGDHQNQFYNISVDPYQTQNHYVCGSMYTFYGQSIRHLAVEPVSITRNEKHHLEP